MADTPETHNSGTPEAGSAKSGSAKSGSYQSESHTTSLPPGKAPHSGDFSRQVGDKAARKLQARRNPAPGVWFGLGMMGLIGWSVTIPTLIGIALGIWLDKVHPGERSWTLALLVAGLVIGCFNAWHWVDKEDKAMRSSRHEDDNNE